MSRARLFRRLIDLGLRPRGRNDGDVLVGHLSRRELMTPDEIMRLDSSLEILLRQGAAPAIAAKVRYYDGPEFRGLFTAA